MPSRLFWNWCWLALLVLTALSLLWRLPGYQFDTSLLALLPDVHAQGMSRERQQADQHLAQLGNRRFVVAVSAASEKQSLQLAKRLKSALVDDQWRYLEPRQQAEQQSAVYWPLRYGLLTDDDRDLIDHQPQALLAKARARLFAPVGNGHYDPINDPLFLFEDFLQARALSQQLQLDHGFLSGYYRGRLWRLLSFQLNDDAFSGALNSRLPAKLAHFRATLLEGAELLASGLILHAAHGARQARTEMGVIGSGSLLGVLLLLFAAFGWSSVRLLAALAAGLLMAFATSLWLFDHLHLITLAFGASLIGVAIDYGIHARNAQLHGVSLGVLTPAMVLSLLTSVLAYGLQALVSMPGLRQMALFSCVGLLSVWLSVMLWLPDARPAISSRALTQLYRLSDYWAGRGHRVPLPVGAKLVLLVLVGVSLLWLPGRDNVHELQTSPPSLLAQAQALSDMTQAPKPSRYLLVAADSLAAASETEQVLVSALKSHGIGSQSLSDSLPGPLQRQADYQRLAQFYRAYLPEWFQSLGALELLPQALAALAPAPVTESSVQASALEPYVRIADPVLVFIYPDKPLTEALVQSLPKGSWVYVDRVKELSQLLADYRSGLVHWLLAAVALICALLYGLYGRNGPLLVLVPLACALVVLWGLVMGFGGVNLFHCLALLLVLGVGFDSALFYARSADVRAWRGATLSILTSLLAFGLLALCKTPVLTSFGVVCAAGLLLVWIMVPMWVQPIVRRNTDDRMAHDR